jgi:hypothetical protein
MTDIDKLFKKINDLAEDYAKTIVVNSAILTYAKIKELTPIDSGNIRKAWEIDLGAGYSRIQSKGTGGTAGLVSSYKLGDTITIRNQEPYAEKLEYGGYGDGPKTIGGFSTQAPAGMMRIGALSFRQHLNRQLAETKL